MDVFGLNRKLLFSALVIILPSSLCVQFSTVLITRNGKIVCSGSLTNTRTVLTAASCVEDGFRYEYRVLFDRKQKYPTALESITINKNYKGTKNNIAILHLRIPAMDGRRFVRVHGRLATRMYDEKTLLGNIQCYIVDLKKDKMFNVEILSAARCSRNLRKDVDEAHICTKLIGPLRKKCPSGAGNPIICKGNGKNWAQVGIHIDNTCLNKPMIATRTSAYRQWLRRNALSLIAESKENTEEPGENDNEINEEDKNKNETTTDETTRSTNSSENTGSNSSTTVTCIDSEYQCSDGTCIPETEVCDGTVQCPSGPEDESSCGCDLAGTEFITAFFNNIGPAVSILYITAPDGANVTVTIPALSYVETREITQAEKWSIEDTSLIIAELMSDKGVHISSDTPITVVAANSREVSYSTIDGTIVYPLTCLSNSYTVELQSHRFYKASQFAVIGVLPNTVVTTTNRFGTVKTVTLGFLDVYFLQGKDLRGLTIQATENVVVNSGSQCGYVPSNMTASCDHMVNQVPPNTNLDKSYIISPQKPRTGYLYRVRAAEDGTIVVIRDQSGTITETATINKFTDFVRTVPDSSTYSIVSDKGTMVTQYALDATLDGLGLGDPSMIILQSLYQFDTRYDFIIPDHILRVGLTVTISTSHDVSGLRLNNKELDIFGMTTVDVTGVGAYNVIDIDLNSKWATEVYAYLTHTDANVSFGAMMYGIRVEGAFAWRIGGKI